MSKIGIRFGVPVFVFMLLAVSACQTHTSNGRLKSKLVGTWVVDLDTTMQYNTITNVSPRVTALLKCSIENTELIIDREVIKYVVRDHECTHAEKKARIQGVNDVFEYKIVSNSEAATILDAWWPKNSISSEDNRLQLNWITSSSFWVEEDYDKISKMRYFYKRSEL